ncbi:MAG TPA: ABC transporter permease [Steroidobacteraceae bacterium]|jgi:putative ABC transport system permease protein|nr:ABC transporter permease [Steroidobacteraceae bacterium]
MSFLKQTLALTASGLRGIPQRRGSSFVTVIGVTTVVGVLTSLLSIRDGATIFTGGNSPKDQAVVLSRGANGAPQSALPREAVSIIESAPGVKHTPDGRPYSVFTTMVPVDAIRRDGKRGNVYLVGFTPGTEIVQTPVKLIAGRMYKPAVHEVIVSEPIRKMYKNMEIGSHIVLRGTEWTVVGVFAGSDSLGDSVLRADCETVMSAFGRNTFQQGLVALESPAAYQAFKDAITSNPAVTMDVKTVEQSMKDNFGQLTALLSFVSYFVGTVMASGAIFGALNSLYASVDARRREIATLRAIGFSSGPIILSVLIEGMLLALPGAFLGALIAWALFNGNVVDVQGLIFKLTVTPHLLVVSIFWALFIGLIGGSLPALRAARLPVATALRAT